MTKILAILAATVVISACAAQPLYFDKNKEPASTLIYMKVTDINDAISQGLTPDAGYCKTHPDPACANLSQYNLVKGQMSQRGSFVTFSRVLVQKTEPVNVGDIVKLEAMNNGAQMKQRGRWAHYLEIAHRYAEATNPKCGYITPFVFFNEGVVCNGWDYRTDLHGD